MLIVTMFTAFRDFSLAEAEHLYGLLITVNKMSCTAEDARQRRLPAAH
jgi:hypothetical protein